MPGMPQVPPDEELVVLRARVAELEARLAARDARLEAAHAQIAVLAGQVEELRRRLGKDSSLVAKCCPACGETTAGLAPEGVTSLVQYGPGVHARAALAVCAHYLPVARAAGLVTALTGVSVSAGFMASVR